MKEILILCLTRFGDLIQATPLIRVLRAAHPGARITLAAQTGFGGILPMMPGVDRTFIFDQSQAARLISDADDPLTAYRHMDEFMQLLEADHYDLVVNLTCSKLSAYICSLLDADYVSGITAQDNGQRVIQGEWGLYLFSLLYGDSRRLSRINLVDIFTRMGGVSPDGQGVGLEETASAQAFADQFVRSETDTTRELVGIQLGASESARCWPLESFARLSDQLQETGRYQTILFGSPKEKELAEAAVAMMQIPPVNAVGRTSIEELLSLVKRCRLLVSNDTGTMHFAAAAGTPALMLCLGPAFFQCTGPYSAGNLALQPALHCAPCRYNLNCLDPVCREELTVQSVLAASLIVLEGGPIAPADFTGVKVYRSAFGEDGFLYWQGFMNTLRDEELLPQRFAAMWKACLDRKPPVADHQGLEHPFSELWMLLDKGEGITAELVRIALQSPLPMEKVAILGEREAEVEAELKLLCSRCPETSPILDYLTMLRENITVEGLHGIASETMQLYRTGKQLLAAL
jgi:ADP-heptose:LPS heptosyltransferase